LARAVKGPNGWEKREERKAWLEMRAAAAQEPDIKDAVEQRLAAEPPFDPGNPPHDNLLRQILAVYE